MADTASVLSVSSLGCVGDGRCASAVYTLASPTVVLLEQGGIVNIDVFVGYNVREDRIPFLFCDGRRASCFIDEIPRLDEHASMFLVLWVISTLER